MNVVSLRVITHDVAGLVEFYERVTGVPAAWSTPDFAELVTPACTLAVASSRTVALFGEDYARPAANRTVIIEFRVADVDATTHLTRAHIRDRRGSLAQGAFGRRREDVRGPLD